MRSDSDIEQDVQNKLESDPNLHDTDIAITVKNGIVTLVGFVSGIRQKRNVENLASSVVGAAGLVNDIELRLPLLQRRPDPEIARDAVEAINRQLPYSGESIRVVVEDVLITLEGQVEWVYQNQDAAEVAQAVRGVRGLVNKLDVCSYVPSSEIRHKMEQALLAAAAFDANSKSKETGHNGMGLLGALRYWAEREGTPLDVWNEQQSS